MSDKEGSPVSGNDDKLWRLIGGLETQLGGVGTKIDGLSGDVKDLSGKVDLLNGDVAATVKSTECAAVHDKLDRSVKQLFANVNKKQTKEVPAITKEMLAPKKNMLVKARDNITAVAAIVLAVGAIGGAIFYGAHILVKIDEAFALSKRHQVEEIKKVEAKMKAMPKRFTPVPMPPILMPADARPISKRPPRRRPGRNR